MIIIIIKVDVYKVNVLIFDLIWGCYYFLIYKFINGENFVGFLVLKDGCNI